MDYNSGVVNPQLRRPLPDVSGLGAPEHLRPRAVELPKAYAFGNTYLQIITKWIAVPAMTMMWNSSW